MAMTPYAQATEFALRQHEVHLTAINQNKTETITFKNGRSFEQHLIRGRTFQRNEGDEIEKWITLGQRNGFNVYFNINGLSVPLGRYHKKANEGDVSVLYALHLDLDDPKDVTKPSQFAKAHRDTLKGLLDSTAVPPPSLVIDSGNGFGAFWTVAPATKVTEENRHVLKSYNKGIRELFGADACEDLCRVMRLPFTTNFPSAAKIARGRKPVMSSVVYDNRSDILDGYPLTDFPQAKVAPKPTTFSTRKRNGQEGSAYAAIGKPAVPADASLLVKSKAFRAIDPYLQDMILTEKIEVGKRSTAVMTICCELRRLGWDDGEIIAIIIEPKLAISEHILEQKQRHPVEQASRMIFAVNSFGVVPYAREFDDDEEAEV